MRILGSFVKNCVRWSRYQLEEARVDAYSHVPTLLDLARSCKRLKVLRVGNRSNLHLEAIMKITALCPSLESFHVPLPIGLGQLFALPNAARMKSIFLGIPHTRVDFLQIFPVTMSNLTRLYLHVPSERPRTVNIGLKAVGLHPSSTEPKG
jgi:hypothetical protein